ncbi:hypothetical protein A9404_03550 [Halothiobacillus diazotrophicus]|uniref:Uncharacterized protein n=1 Tax=Halothiobacillus diazotrophicus TaxID=1860122 RepID=A0A191ZFD4_9GAMM|nr:hypothetical protein [Halothiobacillus diazotrophicus]ANJ66578.1 hypothetical protein A9404_03550 [Halothiobacillus diazotrophicus]
METNKKFNRMLIRMDSNNTVIAHVEGSRQGIILHDLEVIKGKRPNSELVVGKTFKDTTTLRQAVINQMARHTMSRT